MAVRFTSELKIWNNFIWINKPISVCNWQHSRNNRKFANVEKFDEFNCTLFPFLSTVCKLPAIFQRILLSIQNKLKTGYIKKFDSQITTKTSSRAKKNHANVASLWAYGLIRLPKNIILLVKEKKKKLMLEITRK